MTIIPSPRVGHSLTSFKGGKKIILFGGASFEEGYSNDVWIFDSEKQDWQLMNMSISSKERNEKGELQFPSPRYEHSAQLIAEDHLAIFGGCSDDGLLNDLWLLDLGLFNTIRVLTRSFSCFFPSQLDLPKDAFQLRFRSQSKNNSMCKSGSNEREFRRDG